MVRTWILVKEFNNPRGWVLRNNRRTKDMQNHWSLRLRRREGQVLRDQDYLTPGLTDRCFGWLQSGWRSRPVKFGLRPGVSGRSRLLWRRRELFDFETRAAKVAGTPSCLNSGLLVIRCVSCLTNKPMCARVLCSVTRVGKVCPNASVECDPRAKKLVLP